MATPKITSYGGISKTEIVLEKIASILAVELTNQIDLAQIILGNDPTPEEEKNAQLTIDSIPKFVSIQKIRTFEQSTESYLNVWFDGSRFSSEAGGAVGGAQTGEATFVLEIGSSEIAPSQVNVDPQNPNIEPDTSGDQRANAKLDRLSLLCRWILQNPIYRFLGLEDQKIVMSREVRSLVKTFPTEKQNGLNRIMVRIEIAVNLSETLGTADTNLNINEFKFDLLPEGTAESTDQKPFTFNIQHN